MAERRRRRRRSRSSSTRPTGSSRSCSAQTNSSSSRRTTARTSITLAFAVDDVADAAENAAELLGLYGVETPTKQAIELCGLLVARDRASSRRCSASCKGLRGSSDEIRAIKEIEDEADDVARAARASLFKDDRIDPVIVIRWKDIYEALEDAVDACETAAHRVGNILVKNA